MKTRSGEVSPVLIRFTTKDIRDSLLRSDRYLREYGLKAAPGYTKAEREARNKLRPILEQAKSKGRCDAFLRGTILEIGD